MLETSIEAQPQGLVLWRSLTQWLGRVGFAVLVVAAAPSGGLSFQRVLSAEATGPTVERRTPHIAHTAKLLWASYLILTVLGFFALLVAGMGASARSTTSSRPCRPAGSRAGRSRSPPSDRFPSSSFSSGSCCWGRQNGNRPHDDGRLWPDHFALLLVLVLVFVGGCEARRPADSRSSGWRCSRRSPGLMVFIVASVAMAGLGLDFQSAIGTVAATLNTVGPSIGPTDYADVPEAGRLLLAAACWSGASRS